MRAPRLRHEVKEGQQVRGTGRIISVPTGKQLSGAS